jgi:hypothetical protein
MRSRRRSPRRASGSLALAWLLAAALGCTSGWAYTATNTVASAGAAGQGSAAINPYTIGSVAYTLNVNSPQNIDQVTFTLSPTAATTTKAQLVSAGSWYGCTNSAGNVTCAATAPQASATTADNLTIVAAQ